MSKNAIIKAAKATTKVVKMELSIIIVCYDLMN